VNLDWSFVAHLVRRDVTGVKFEISVGGWVLMDVTAAPVDEKINF